ncbi:alpha-E domain-containing protein [Pontibacter diazotrophicus]|uniref:Alpha-E domain-containing protein n=1 Tax=Pontibacter diazotrophicus TaxID=1400979 RepID=A0A3D8LD73_9BACT|nr:alpha-E domain-containing protein [Pontibacter diazotrophicus]RDV15355.1 alpha-E domain-containing protein [Pontibacter diazotrophicus]
MMLSRSAKKIYWMGRDLEWAEFVALYSRVQYENLMDLPARQSKEDLLESILHVADAQENYFSVHSQLKAEDVLTFICIEEANPNSVLAYVDRVREMARGARDGLSLELWEYVNRFYHTMNSYSTERLHREGIQGFAGAIESNSCRIKGYIHNNMLRNEAWMLFSLGMYMERAFLITRTLLHQMQAIATQESSGQNGPDESYQFALLLGSIGGYEMFKQGYQKNASRKLALDFLLLNTEFPKSVVHTLTSIHTILKDLHAARQEQESALQSTSHTILSQCQDFTPGDQAESTVDFLKKTLANLHALAGQLEQTYLKF